MLFAYVTNNNIFIFSDSKNIKAILKGHKYKISNVSFESKSLNLVSSDIEGYCYFWYFQESIWQNTKIIKINPETTCISWFLSRRLISFSSNVGLELSRTIENDEKIIKLIPNSTFSCFNYDGSILCSHNNDKLLHLFFLIKIK